MTQNNYFLNLLEKFCRSNIYIFLLSRYIVGKFFSKYIYDSDFKIINFLNKKNIFEKKNGIILDIGANDGMSYYIIRKFSKNTKIISFEPNNTNFKKLKKIEKIDRLFKCKNFALSNKNKIQNFFTPFFKNFPISQISGISKDGVKARLKESLFVKDLFKKIVLKKEKLITKKLDIFNYKPCFIKIDIEGHELECVKGSLKTIKKHTPILMIEYDKKICNKIYLLLKKYKYQRFIYNNVDDKIEKFKFQKIFNIFFINQKFLKQINDYN